MPFVGAPPSSDTSSDKERVCQSVPLKEVTGSAAREREGVLTRPGPVGGAVSG